MNSTPRRPSGWKVFGIIAGTVVVIAVAAAVWLKVATDRRREDLERQLKAEIAAIRARSGERSVLVGTAQPGNAWVDYDPALAASKLLTRKTSYRAILDENHDDKPEGPLSQLPLYASPIADLRRGARRAEAKKDYEWERGGAAATPPLSECHQLASYALLDARVLAKEGKTAEAVEEILDVLQFGRDLANDGLVITSMIGMAVCDSALGEARHLLVGGTLDARGRQALERGLRTLDAGFPSIEDAAVRESVAFGTSLCQESRTLLTGLLYLGPIQRRWEYAERLAAASRVSWPATLQVHAEVQAEIARAWNPMTKMLATTYPESVGRSSRRCRAQIRLLLGAVHYQDTGELPDLDDPFATKLKSSVAGDTLKIWSVGPDSVDDGGSGGWKANDGKDVVLEVPR